MNHILYVNCCMRKEGQSRTRRLADAFLTSYRDAHPEDLIQEVCLPEEPIRCLLDQDVELRDRLLREGRTDHPMFSYAKQFAAADKILVAAPFWDLSIPALLKAYIENVCVCGLTFRYTDAGQEGICRGEKLLFLTTRGGEFEEGLYAPYEMGARYLHAMCSLWGIPQFESIAAEGLDIVTRDGEQIMAAALDQARALALEW